jgi:two-component system, NarL family, response regulator
MYLPRSGGIVSSNPNFIRILTVDDHALLREGIAALVKAEHDIQVVAEACDGEDAIEQFRKHLPDVTLMDLQMPSINGTEAISRIRNEFPNARIIVLTTYSGDVQVLKAIRAGARGYVLKAHVHRELMDAIRSVHAGHKRIPPEIASKLAEHAAEDELSSREVEVVRLIAAGNPNKEIASKLCIGETTVKSHISNILSKLGANDRTHAVTIGLRRGIIELASL